MTAKGTTPKTVLTVEDNDLNPEAVHRPLAGRPVSEEWSGDVKSGVVMDGEYTAEIRSGSYPVATEMKRAQPTNGQALVFIGRSGGI